MEPEHEVEPEPPIVVVDHGTRFTKFGLSTDSAPQKVRTVVGYPKRNVADSVRFKESYVGDEAMSFRHAGLLDLKHPYRDGKIQSFEDIEIIWLHIFKVLKVDPKKAVLFLTQSHFGHPDGNNKDMITQAFKRLFVKGLIVCNKSVLSMYQTKKLTGKTSNCCQVIFVIRLPYNTVNL
ncbi:actin-7-like protein isoform X2 [Tanacetum coccineum]